jgi:ERO1-like protein beta
MLDKETGEWVPDLQCFISRVAAFPERLQYIYFDAVLMLRAVARIAPYLSSYDYCSTGTHEDDAQTLAKMGRVVDIASRVGRFDETVLFRGANAQVLKEEFKDHFRNVTRIMDCVGCDKCRLWGKVQTTGIATAMKILFEIDENALEYVASPVSTLPSHTELFSSSPKTNPNLLQRSEVVALINTLHRLFESLHAVRGFRKMWANTDKEVSEKLLRHAEKVADAAGKVS